MSCDDCKYGEPVLADSRIWCKQPASTKGRTTLAKDYWCDKYQKAQNTSKDK